MFLSAVSSVFAAVLAASAVSSSLLVLTLGVAGLLVVFFLGYGLFRWRMRRRLSQLSMPPLVGLSALDEEVFSPEDRLELTAMLDQVFMEESAMMRAEALDALRNAAALRARVTAVAWSVEAPAGAGQARSVALSFDSGDRVRVSGVERTAELVGCRLVEVIQTSASLVLVFAEGPVLHARNVTRVLSGPNRSPFD